MDRLVARVLIGSLGLFLIACSDPLPEADLQGSEAFQLSYCSSEGDCREGTICLPAACGDQCIPDPDGRCKECPAGARGICMPPPSSGDQDPDPNGSGGQGPIGECFADRLGEPGACGARMDWARMALDTCAARGSILIDLHSLLTCPDGWPSGVVFTCCAWGDLPPDQPWDPPMPEECMELPIPADPNDPANDPKSVAWDMCLQMGMDLRDLYPLDGQENGLIMTWMAVCCLGGGHPPDEPPPHDHQCEWIPSGDGNCNGQTDWKRELHERCASMGGDLRDVEFVPGCPDGSPLHATGLCCFGSNQPPNPGPETCFQEPIGDGTCGNDPGFDLKMMAHERCMALGAELRDLAIRHTCADGSYGALIATCCMPSYDEPPPVDPPRPEGCEEVPLPWDPADSSTDPKEMAYRVCSQKNLILADLYPRIMEDGTIRAWVALCCATP
jgi:hypothetical protein